MTANIHKVPNSIFFFFEKKLQIKYFTYRIYYYICTYICISIYYMYRSIYTKQFLLLAFVDYITRLF